MTRFAIAVLAAVTLAQPAPSVAADNPTGAGAKPSSFVPHPRTHRHVYGAPIQPAIVGHTKTSHHKHTTKKRSSRPPKRAAQRTGCCWPTVPRSRKLA
jgi:hypothetical protein